MPVEKKTHCPQGHPYAGDNLIIYRPSGLESKFERRVCRACKLAQSRAQYERKALGIAPGPRGRPRTAHCPKGHEKSMENLVISYSKRVRGRGEEYWYPVHICKKCQTENTQRIRAAKKEAKENGPTKKHALRKRSPKVGK